MLVKQVRRQQVVLQQHDDPTKFVHAVRQFEAVYVPELAAGPVIFTDYVVVATIQR